MENDHKRKWEDLAQDPDMEEKYIYTDGDIGFRESGKRDYERLIKNDKVIQDHLGPFEYRTIMEIGCGTGRMTEFMARDFAGVYALDVSRKMVEEGKKRLSGLAETPWDYENIEWIETDGAHLPAAVKVDLIFSYIVLQHCPLEIIRSIIQDARKSLAPGGIMKIQVRGREIRQDKWYSGKWFTPSEITLLMDACGFQVEKIWHDPEEGRYLWIWVI